MSSRQATARSLIAASMDLRRVLRRHHPETTDMTLTVAQSELMRDIEAHPGTRVSAAATRLDVAQNTVSSLVRQLVEIDLVERRPDPTDGRAVLLHPSAGRNERRNRRADQRVTVLAGAMADLDDQQREQLQAALPIIQRLVEAVRDSPAPRVRRGTSDAAHTMYAD